MTVTINGKTYKMRVAKAIGRYKRVQVWNGTAYKTSHGKKGLTKNDLVKKKGRILSKKASKSASKNKNLGKYVDLAKKNKGSRGLILMRKGMNTRKKSRGKAPKRRKTARKGRRCRNTRGRYKRC